MHYREFSPEELIAVGFDSPEVTDHPWTVRWDRYRGSAAELVLSALPESVSFETSGTTGQSQSWSRPRESLWAEVSMLAGLVGPHQPRAALCSVHPHHLYGALSSVLLPAHLGIPAWFRPGFIGEMPPADSADSWLVTAIPWTFSLLRRNLPWVRSAGRVTVLHASGMIPDAALEFLDEAGAAQARVVEVFGATESGGVATRQWSAGTPPHWSLIDDVSFADSLRENEGEVSLRVRSPRLAHRPGEPHPESCLLDDHVERLDERTFRFSGRRTRLVNINGRRLNLDRLEDLLTPIEGCLDLAVRPVSDPMIGEHIELYLVLDKGIALGDLDLAAAFARIGIRPRRICSVDEIDRTEIGKFRRIHQTVTTDQGVSS
ncbi:hypothetical protein ACFVWF_28740 [Rhodococcus qingshengii]|uniref:hypothetical protein n=1 Tax=Rhodococcus qingshengii TaxID=334542 RepID=UPI0036D8AB0C